MAGVWILDYLRLSHIVSLNLGLIRVQLHNGRGSWVVQDPHANYQLTEQKVLLFVVHI